MRTRRRRPTPPADANELLAALWAARLLSPKQLRRLAIDWSESRPDEPDDPAQGTRRRALELSATGLLTAWQIERVLAGEARRLKVGPYRLLERAGAGGMGTVYRAEHRLMKRVVALKALRRGPARAAGWREAEAAARLSHPNIVAAHDAVRAGGAFFLVMEFVEGLDLGRLLTESGPLPLQMACEAIRQAALALHHAHAHGLLHCDVKPSNLMLVRPAAQVTVKLLDMGLARRMGDPDAGDAEAWATPDYLAPERGAGEAIDGRSDLYSLGCTFYHLLTGQPPFPGGDAGSKLLRHRLDSPAPVRDLRADVPADVAEVVRRLTARDPAERYATGAEAAAALETAASGGRMPPDGESGPTSASSHQGAYAPRSLLPAAAAVIGAVFLAAAAYRVLPTPAPQPSPPPLTPFVIEGRSGGFASLSEAVAAADDGAVVAVHGTGPYETPPLAWHGRRLTIRAAGDGRPCVELTTAPADPWRTLLATDADLTLEGLDLRAPAGAGGRLICCERASLRLKDCRLAAPHGAGIVHRRAAALSLEGCSCETWGAAVSAEVGEKDTYTVHIRDSVLDAREPGGAALALWAPGAGVRTTAEVELTGSTLRAARAVALTALPAGLRVTARGDEFFVREAVFSCAGCGDRQTWRRTATWDGGGNTYHAADPWLLVNGVAADVRGLAAWRGLWSGGEAGSREAP